MTRNEFEQHKRALDDRLRLAMELLQAGHGAQVQALETAWRASEAEAAAEPGPPRDAEAAPSGPPVRKPTGTLYAEVLSALPHLPEEFDKNDVLRALGFSPDRVALFRVLQTLDFEGRIELKTHGAGRKTTVYRKKHDGAAVPGG
jgi:hypothetical protein